LLQDEKKIRQEIRDVIRQITASVVSRKNSDEAYPFLLSAPLAK
jgi:hypothetical protein